MQIQAAYRAHHSTETALLQMQDYILSCTEKGEVVLLLLLDRSAAVGTIEHLKLLDHLHTLGIRDTALVWIASYLKDRNQVVKLMSKKGERVLSHKVHLSCGVPQGSLIGPILFISFTMPLQSVIKNHNVLGVSFADDTQVAKSFKPTKSAFCEATIVLDFLVSDVVHWMTLNGLKINPEKTGVLLLGTAQDCAKFQEICPEMKIMLGSQNLPISSTCRNLGFWFDAQLSGRAHASQVTCKCMFNLKHLRRVRGQLDDETTKTVIQALVHI